MNIQKTKISSDWQQVKLGDIGNTYQNFVGKIKDNLDPKIKI